MGAAGSAQEGRGEARAARRGPIAESAEKSAERVGDFGTECAESRAGRGGEGSGEGRGGEGRSGGGGEGGGGEGGEGGGGEALSLDVFSYPSNPNPDPNPNPNPNPNPSPNPNPKP